MPDKSTKKKINPFKVFEAILRWIGYSIAILALLAFFGALPIFNTIEGRSPWVVFAPYLFFLTIAVVSFFGSIIVYGIQDWYESMKRKWIRRNYESNINE